MARHIFYCKDCDVFTMEKQCSKCKADTLSTIPAKFSIEDKWGRYRQMGRKQ
ncbi:MAG: nucleolar RNA-binding Nop10p family protein [archaeon]